MCKLIFNSLVVLTLAVTSSVVYAAPLANSVFQQPVSKAVQGQASAPLVNPGAPVLNASGYFLQDVNSGKVLASQNPDTPVEPASLTKLMTLYIAFEALQANRIKITDNIPISEAAWKTGGSRMFVKVGDSVPLMTLIQGVIVDSGNDATTALAEYVGGTQAGFVELMNQQAQLLGMKNTHYVDPTGLPDKAHYSTPRDIAILARAMILNFPEYYKYFSEKTLTYNNITQPNRNRLLWSDPTVDGLKTGHTDGAGYCLVASADRNNMRLVSVLLGAPSDAARSQYSENLLNYGFRFFETHKIYGADQPIQNAKIVFGKEKVVPIGLSRDLYVTVPMGEYTKVVKQLKINTPLKAPLNRGQAIGTLGISLNGESLGTENIVALTTVQQGGMFTRLAGHLKMALGKG